MCAAHYAKYQQGNEDGKFGTGTHDRITFVIRMERSVSRLVPDSPMAESPKDGGLLVLWDATRRVVGKPGDRNPYEQHNAGGRKIGLNWRKPGDRAT